MTDPVRLNLYIVDDDEAVRRSLGLLLLSRGHTVQAFDSGESFLAGADTRSAGCVVLDLRLSGMSGLQVFDVLCAQESPLVVLFLSGHGDIPMAVRAVRKGAWGWLEKPCGEAQLLESLNQALAQASAAGRHLLARKAAQALWTKLTPREMQVAKLMAQGFSNKQVAAELSPLELRTVETHRAHVFAKLGLANSHQLERFLREHSL